MGTAWASHYRKNRPGYRNPWDNCTGEIYAMLGCVAPMQMKPLDITFSGYTSGIDRTVIDGLADHIKYYAGSTGLYELSVTTGDPPVRIPNVDVELQIFNASGTGTALNPRPSTNTIVNRKFKTDAQGFASGAFGLPPVVPLWNEDTSAWEWGELLVSGRVFAYSGFAPSGYVGYYEWGTPLILFPQPTVTLTWDVPNNTVYGSITNSDSYLSAEIGLEYSSDYEQTYTAYPQVWNVEPGTYVEFSLPNNFLGWNFLYFRAFAHPVGFTRSLEVFGPSNTSGGHPPLPTGTNLRYTFPIPNSVTREANIEIFFEAYKSGAYDGWGMNFDTWYSGEGGTEWTQLLEGEEMLSGSCLKRCESACANKGVFYFKTSGNWQYKFYSPEYHFGPIDFSKIIAHAETSLLSGCGVDLRWDAPNPLNGEHYHVFISGENDTDGWQGEFHADETDQWGRGYAYFHDTSENCGKVYCYKVCYSNDNNACSDIVSGSGLLKLRPPAYTAYPQYLPEQASLRPTTQFDVYLYWGEQKSYEPKAEYLTGYRTFFNKDAETKSKEIELPYHDYVGQVDNNDRPFDIDTGTALAHATEETNVIEYSLRLATGRSIEYPIVSEFANASCNVPRYQAAPSFTYGALVPNTNQLELRWTGFVWEAPDSEAYLLWKSGTISDTQEKYFNLLHSGHDTSIIDDVSVAGNWTYILETQGRFPSALRFTTLSVLATTGFVNG